ncbi:MAG: hypothetical protein Q8R35_00970 [bacterium]|nr:hypothetical protein [bacterium]
MWSRGESPFAITLKKILDFEITQDTEWKFLGREGWAKVLGVAPEKIDAWRRDEAVPEPEHLISILNVLYEDIRAPRELLEEFDALAAKPVEEVTPFAHDIRQRFWHVRRLRDYAVISLLRGVLGTLGMLDWWRQYQLLGKLGEAAWKEVDRGSYPRPAFGEKFGEMVQKTLRGAGGTPAGEE